MFVGASSNNEGLWYDFSCAGFHAFVCQFPNILDPAGPRKSQRQDFRAQRWSDWPQMGQIRDFLRSDFSTIWLAEPNCTEI